MNYSAAEHIDRLELTGRVREALRDLMDVERYQWDERGALTLRGRLAAPADALYGAIRARLESLGFTPFLRRDAGADELLAVPGVIERRQPRVGLPVALFLATIATVLLTGALNEGANPFRDPASIVAGVPFAARQHSTSRRA